MSGRPLNLWIPYDVWLRIHHLKETEGFNPSQFFIEIFEQMHKVETNSLDEENLLSEIEALRNHIDSRNDMLQEKLVYFQKLKTEREKAREQELKIIHMNADVMRRQLRDEI